MTARLIAGACRPPDGPYDVDIVILALERTDETLAAIASASCQVGVSAHIFVLDQGSCSETMVRLAAAVQGRRDVTLLAAARNLGVAGGRNLISDMGHGRVIVALDNDAEFTADDTVARMVAALDAEPRLGAIGCRIVRHSDGTDDLSSWGYPAGLLACAGESFDAVTYVGAGHAILREAWQQAGGYDAKLFFCWEEFDFCLRAIALGWQIRYRGDIAIRHKVAAQQRVDWTATRWFYFVRNRIYIERKLDRGWCALAPRILGYVLKGWRNGRPVQTLRAISAAVAMAPRSGRTMPQAGLSYLSRNDRVHRGSLWRRLTREVLSRIGPPSAASPAKR
jgi:GT2 family glycosyltransferase